MKLCECGCGSPTKLSLYNNSERGYVKGVARRFLLGHGTGKGRRSVGDKRVRPRGYVWVYMPGHPRASKGGAGEVPEHVLVVEAAMGKYLAAKHPVHHVNELKGDNRPGNLVVCQDAAYHELLHRRQRALDACGHVDWVKCNVCFEYDDPNTADMWVSTTKPSRAHHRACHMVRERYNQRRQHRAFAATGNPDSRQCAYCKEWGDPAEMKSFGKNVLHHPECKRNWNKSGHFKVAPAIAATVTEKVA